MLLGLDLYYVNSQFRPCLQMISMRLSLLPHQVLCQRWMSCDNKDESQASEVHVFSKQIFRVIARFESDMLGNIPISGLTCTLASDQSSSHSTQFGKILEM